MHPTLWWRISRSFVCLLFYLSVYYPGWGQCDDLSPEEHSVYEGLLSFYSSTAGNSWINNTGWGENCDYCSWYGVVCNNDEGFIGLSLSWNNLEGPLDITPLVPLNIKYLNLSGNSFKSIIPTNISALKDAYFVRLNSCDLHGPIPENITNLSGLEYLNLDFNNLTGSIPDGIGALNNLKTLILSSNELTGEIPSSFEDLTGLISLFLSYNQLSGELPSFANFNNIINIGLNDNQLTGHLPGELGSLASLRFLNINNNQLDGCFEEELLSLCDQDVNFLYQNNCFNQSFSNFCNRVSCPENPATINSSENPICSGSELSLSVDQTMFSSIIWSTGDIDFSILDYPTESTSYSVTVTNEYGCEFRSHIEIEVIPAPFLHLEEEICPGNEISIGTFSYTEPGYYEVPLKSQDGCDSIIYLDLSVLPEENLHLKATICDGESYEYGGNIFTQSGYYEFGIAGDQCDTLVYLDLIILPELSSDLDIELCHGESYQINNEIFLESGQYTIDLMSKDGCDSTVFLTLYIEEKNETAVIDYSCSGTVYYYRDQSFTESGTYEFVVPDEGCDLEVTLHLTFLPANQVSIIETICDGEELKIGDAYFYDSGEYSIVLEADNGCDSIINLSLFVLPQKYSSFTTYICPEDLLLVADQDIYDPGFYEIVTTSANGCDSVIYADVKAKEAYETFTTVQLCPGFTYEFQEEILDHPGQYTFYLEATDGCDSIIYLEIEQKDQKIEFQTSYLCEFGEFTIHGFTFTESGDYELEYEDNQDCPVKLYLNLTEVLTDFDYSYFELCPGEVVYRKDQVYDAAGYYEVTYQNRFGCDSIEYVELVYLPGDSALVDAFICKGEIYEWENQVFSSPGIYQMIFENKDGCDSILTLDLSILPRPEKSLEIWLCGREEFEYRDKHFNQPGFYEMLLPGNPCDTTVYLLIESAPNYIIHSAQSICSGESFTFNGIQLREEGTYIDSLNSKFGCDSLLILDLSIIENEPIYEEASICAGESLFQEKDTLYESGIYYYEKIHENGCPQEIELQLIVEPSHNTSDTISLCENQTINWNNQEISTPGKYQHTLSSFFGCDSLIELVVEEGVAFTISDSIVLCEGSSFSWGEELISEPGDYYKPYLTSRGCDSIHHLHVQFTDITTIKFTEHLCEGEVFILNGEPIYESGVYEQYLDGNGCDSVLIYDVHFRQSTLSKETISICKGESILWKGVEISREGTYEKNYVDSWGCDSILQLLVSIVEHSEQDLFLQVCGGIDWQGNYLDQSGLYSWEGKTALGCDSIIRLNLDVISETKTDIYAEFCPGEVYEFLDSVYDQPGIYSHHLISNHGCDSVVFLHLDQSRIDSVKLKGNICPGQTFEYNGYSFSAPGVYDILIPSASGCHSYLQVEIVLFSEDQIQSVVEKCPDESVIWQDILAHHPGIYSRTIPNRYGCDSTFILEVIERPVSETLLDTSICAGDTFKWNNLALNESGTYTYETNNRWGCDSTATLQLVVNQAIEASQEFILCPGDSLVFGDLIISSPGEYQRVTPGERCDTIFTLNVSEAFLDVELSILESPCGTSPGLLGLGEAGYILEWSDGNRDQIRSFWASGLYEATIYTPRGCSFLTSLYVEVEPIPQFAQVITVLAPESCGEGTSLAPCEEYLISLDSGISWTSEEIFASPGSELKISLAVRDTSCVYLDQFTLTVPPEIDISPEEVQVFQLDSCQEDNARIEITPPFPDIPLLYSIDGGQSYQISSCFDHLGTGRYQIVIKDSTNDCTVAWPESIEIFERPEMEFEVEVVSEILCKGERSGALSINTASGIDIFWSTGQFGSFIDGLGSGIYLATLTDNSGCQEVIEIFLEEGPSLDDLEFLSDTSFCAGDTLWVFVPESPLPLEWSGPERIHHLSKIGFYQPGDYRVEMGTNGFCSFEKRFSLGMVEEDFSGVDFLIGSEGVIGLPLTAIDISWPLSEFSQWVIDSSVTTVISRVGNQLVLQFDTAGIFEIGLESKIGLCTNYVGKKITIYNSRSELENLDGLGSAPGDLLDFSLFPNPNYGIFSAKVLLTKSLDIGLILIDQFGNRLDEKIHSGSNSYYSSYDISIFPPGIYALVLLAGQQHYFILFNKI